VSVYWPAIVDGGIPVLAGMYATAVAYGFAVGPTPKAGPAAKLLPHFKWMGPVLILLGLLLGWQSYSRGAHPSAQQIAQGISARLSPPVQVDEVTRLDAVTGEADVISFNYTILAPLSTADSLDNIRSKLRDAGQAAACTNPDFDKFFSQGYSIELRYAFLESSETVSVLFTPDSCAK
jgi:hypothetical protein